MHIYSYKIEYILFHWKNTTAKVHNNANNKQFDHIISSRICLHENTNPSTHSTQNIIFNIYFIFTDVHLEVSILVQQYEKKINIITYIYNSFNYTEQI